MNNIMIDIETLSSDSNALILSICAVVFNIETGEIGKHTYIEIDINDSLKYNFNISGDTLQWWLKQSNAARKLIHSPNNAFKVKDALEILSKFLKDNGSLEDTLLWGNPSKFDLGILEDAYKILNLKVPWKYVNERCVRTLSNLYPKIKKDVIFKGTKHNPIDDCVYQIEYCHKVWVELFPPTNIEKISSDMVFELKLKIPREFIHIGISNNVFFGKTDSTELYKEINYKLPDGDWVITNAKGTIVTLKNSALK
jgi:hypothetical protein